MASQDKEKSKDKKSDAPFPHGTKGSAYIVRFIDGQPRWIEVLASYGLGEYQDWDLSDGTTARFRTTLEMPYLRDDDVVETESKEEMYRGPDMFCLLHKEKGRVLTVSKGKPTVPYITAFVTEDIVADDNTIHRSVKARLDICVRDKTNDAILSELLKLLKDSTGLEVVRRSTALPPQVHLSGVPIACTLPEFASAETPDDAKFHSKDFYEFPYFDDCSREALEEDHKRQSAEPHALRIVALMGPSLGGPVRVVATKKKEADKCDDTEEDGSMEEEEHTKKDAKRDSSKEL